MKHLKEIAKRHASRLLNSTMISRARLRLGSCNALARPISDEANCAPAGSRQPFSPREQRVLTTIEELDEVLRECDEAQKESDDALRRVFNSFKFKVEGLALPVDPDSAEYREAQRSLYRRISGYDCDISREASNWLDVKKTISVPFPYYTQSYDTVADQLLAIGLIIRLMKLPPGSRSLSLGRAGVTQPCSWRAWATG